MPFIFKGTTVKKLTHMGTVVKTKIFKGVTVFKAEKVLLTAASHILGTITFTKVSTPATAASQSGQFINGDGIYFNGWNVGPDAWVDGYLSFGSTVVTEGYTTLKADYSYNFGTTDAGHSGTGYWGFKIDGNNKSEKNVTWAATKKTGSGTLSLDISNLTSFKLGLYCKINGYGEYDFYINKIWLE